MRKNSLRSRPATAAPRRSVLMLLGAYNPSAHRGIARFAAERRWHLHVDMARVPLVPHGWRGDGIVAGLGEWEEPVDFVRAARRAAIPVVDIYTMRPELALPRVVADHRAVGRQAAEHLLSAGWRRFAWFSREEHPVARLRRESFFETLHAAGVATPALVLAPAVAADRSAHAWDSALAELQLSLAAASRAGPLGVFTFNDYDAALVEAACLDAGLRVPDDVGIVGVDNNELVVNCQPVPLSSVRLELERIGYEGAALLERLMNGEPPPKRPRLVSPGGVAARASTDALPASHPAVRRALAHMRRHLGTKLSVDAIAAACDVPRRTLEVAFRKDLGRSLHAQLTHLRLAEVCRRLENSQDSIETIARACGFAHGPHLHGEFKRARGMSPRAWRLTRRADSAPVT